MKLKVRENIYDSLRRTAEQCECLSSWFVVHSMGGGTGSGLGTNVLTILADEFPNVERLVTPVYPSEDDDVITSPYNSILAMQKLTEFADVVLPVDNASLAQIVTKIKSASNTRSRITENDSNVSDKKSHWKDMNALVAQSILNITSSARFPGSLNVDLNEVIPDFFNLSNAILTKRDNQFYFLIFFLEVSMNLVPFPRMHYLTTCLAPLYLSKDINLPLRRLDEMFRNSSKLIFPRDTGLNLNHILIN